MIFQVLLIVVLSLMGLQGIVHASCKSCHNGIEAISQIKEMNELDCIFCHRGDNSADSKDKAHKNMWANPADLRVVDETCGVCHSDLVKRVRKSLHATSAGIISATRYLFKAQPTKDAIYANYDTKDLDGFVPRELGAIYHLKAIPSFDALRPEGPENSPADDYLRHECLRCHIYSYGAERYGDYRSSGCAACHVIYADDGIYTGQDKAILKKSRGPFPVPRPQRHVITKDIPIYQCIHCHNRGGRTGVSFIGTIESDGYGSPWSCKPGVKGGKKIHGKYYNHLTPDIHFKKGLVCIDCHGSYDVHGDGNIYGKKEQAVEIECEDCHGTLDSKSTLKNSKGRRIKNLVKKDGIIFLKARDGKDHKVPQVIDILTEGNLSAKRAMSIKGHMNRLECYACHARWAPQCYGCHAQQDLTSKSRDWLDLNKAKDESQMGRAKFRKRVGYKWLETRSYIRWEKPILGINSEGKVSPFIPGCQVIFTQIGKDGDCRYHNKIFVLKGGIYSLATNPIQPHTISKRARQCCDCHGNPRTLGLGDDIYDSQANGLSFPYPLDQIVTREGRQVQATSHKGARPFNKHEIQRILKPFRDFCE